MKAVVAAGLEAVSAPGWRVEPVGGGARSLASHDAGQCGAQWCSVPGVRLALRRLAALCSHLPDAKMPLAQVVGDLAMPRGKAGEQRRSAAEHCPCLCPPLPACCRPAVHAPQRAGGRRGAPPRSLAHPAGPHGAAGGGHVRCACEAPAGRQAHRSTALAVHRFTSVFIQAWLELFVGVGMQCCCVHLPCLDCSWGTVQWC